MDTVNAPDTLSAADILRLPPDEPERLFTGEPDAARAEFRRLAALWHPDRNGNPQAVEVFQHIRVLYELAETRLAAGCWKLPNLLCLRALDGRRYEIRYRKQHHFELGDMFIGPEAVAFLLAREHEDLYENALRVLSGFRFASPGMKAEMQGRLPELGAAFRTRDALVLVLRKRPEQVLLRDLLDHQGGRLEAVHVAWITSSLLNLACYLDYAGLSHNAITVDSYFVSPADHDGALLGGWWYAAALGSRLRAAPQVAVNLAPPDMLSSKRADARLDLELARHCARTLLGSPSGSGLLKDPRVPGPLTTWLQMAAGSSAVQDYTVWQERILKESFGHRRFVHLDARADDIYQ